MVAPRFRSGRKKKRFSAFDIVAIGPGCAGIRHRRYRELSRADGADGVARAQTEQIKAERFGQGPVDTGETYLQKNLRIGGGNIDVQQIDHLARGGRNLHRAIGAGEILNRAAQEDLARSRSLPSPAVREALS